MVEHPCSQIQTIKEIQKDVQLSREKDILQSEQILNMQKDLVEIKRMVKEIKENMEKNYASKWVEWVVKGMIGLICLTVFGAMLSKIIVK